MPHDHAAPMEPPPYDPNCRYQAHPSMFGGPQPGQGHVHHHPHAPEHHQHQHQHQHQHRHEHLPHAGRFTQRDAPLYHARNWRERAFTVGIGGPVGSGKTALMLALCRKLYPAHNLACVTNDIFTKEDGEFLMRHDALPHERIVAIETGGCPHAAIREDITANLNALERLSARFGCELLLVESGGDNLAANYSRELADYIIYVIDVAGGDKIPRKGGPGITQSDLLVINKTDLAEHVHADLDVMKRDAALAREHGPTIFAQVTNGVGVDEIVARILEAVSQSGSSVNSGNVPADASLPAASGN